MEARPQRTARRAAARQWNGCPPALVDTSADVEFVDLQLEMFRLYSMNTVRARRVLSMKSISNGYPQPSYLAAARGWRQTTGNGPKPHRLIFRYPIVCSIPAAWDLWWPRTASSCTFPSGRRVPVPQFPLSVSNAERPVARAWRGGVCQEVLHRPDPMEKKNAPKFPFNQHNFSATRPWTPETPRRVLMHEGSLVAPP